MSEWKSQWQRVKGDDNNLLLVRRFFGFWQDFKYYNNEVYRSHAKMNEIVAKLEKEYAECKRLTNKRNALNLSIDNAFHQKEDEGFTEWAKLPWFRKDNKPMEKPPQTWLKFVQPLKNGPSTDLADLGTTTTVELAENSAGSRSYEIKKVNPQQQGKRNRGNQQGNGNN